jgi:rare lipoprotein A
MKKLVSLSVLTALIAGCANMGGSTSEYGSEKLAEETLVTEVKAQDDNAYLMAAAPRYYIGNAYKVEDVQYIPAEDMEYNQTGVAGIIPMELNGNKTSNGEIYDSTQLLATSKTLPLPTIARVTNLENGEAVIVRVNNRGPFVNSRIVDLSPAAAEKLGMNGNTKVQVQVLAEQSKLVKDATLGLAVEPTVAEAPVAETPAAQPAPVVVAPAGDYSVQVAAFYAEDSADALVQKMRNYGDAVVVKEGDMFKVRIVNLDAAGARRVIDALRNNEGMAPGLLKNGRWVNADSI